MSKPDKEEAKQKLEAAATPTVAWGPRKRRAEVKVEKIETEADKQLKDQIRKQLHTDVTLHSELSKRKTFTSASVYDPVRVSGELSLENYQQLSHEASRVQQLRSYRLTEEEIQIKLKEDKGLLSEATGFGADPLVEETILKAINEKIKKHERSVAETSGFTGTKKLGRHEMDLEKALTQSRDKDESKVSEMLVTERQPGHGSSEDGPGLIKGMLMEIERKIHRTDNKESETSSDNESPCESESEALFPEGSVLSISTNCEDCDKLRTKNRYFVGPLLKPEYDYYEKCENCKQLKNKEYNERIVVTRKTILGLKTAKSASKSRKRKKKKKKHNKSEYLGPGAELGEGVLSSDDRHSSVESRHSSVESIPTEVIVKYRLSAQQIKEIPHFANYCPGEPHNTLYVKNLSSQVTEADLKSLFCQFDTSGPIQYRLLARRMRGQAFITFADISTATDALELVHGFQFKGKPVIIQYGKKPAS